MIDLHLYFAFILAATLVLVIPGPAILFIIARSVNLGVKGGIQSIFGLALGSLVYAIAVALGLAQILNSSPEAFMVIKNLGCIYLIYLGLKTFFDKEKDENIENIPAKHSKHIIKEGFFVELLNPKTALFFIAFLPQFTNASMGHMSVQLIILGLTFTAIGLLSDSIFVLISGHMGQVLKQSRLFAKIEKYISGSVYTSLGLAGLFYKMPKS